MSIFYCPIDGCGFSNVLQSGVEEHLQSHLVNGKFTCDNDECHYTTRRVFSFKKHLSTHTNQNYHSVTSRARKALSTTKDSQQALIRRHVEEKRFECSYDGCEECFNDSRSLHKHILEHTSSKPYKCNYAVCLFRFSTEYGLNKHMSSHASVKELGKLSSKRLNLVDEGCNTSNTTKSDVHGQKQAHVDKRSFVCSFKGCNGVFTSSDDWRKHQTSHECDDDSNIRREKYAGLSPLKSNDTNESGLNGDVNVDSDVNVNHEPNKCTFDGCDAVLTQSSDLQSHIITHSVKKPFKCTYNGCDVSFSTSFGLSSHSRIHVVHDPFKCTLNECRASYKTNCWLKSHMRCHSNERPYKCTYDGCFASFFTIGPLRSHLHIHTGERPVKCMFEGCQASFATTGHLKTHARIHATKQYFICTIEGCDALFTSNDDLKIHILKHNGERPYTCTYKGCNIAYDRVNDLLDHFMEHEHK